MKMVRHPFRFSNKAETRREMAALQNRFFQLKYCPYQSDAYHRYREEIESILDGKGATGS
jgi:hypothetical protein